MASRRISAPEGQDVSYWYFRMSLSANVAEDSDVYSLNFNTVSLTVQISFSSGVHVIAVRSSAP
ncbi:MAG: hypothetical protein ACK50J_05125, partial [Planctomyces sp.]